MSSIVVRAEKMAAGGDAIARLADGRVVFVRGALPGESVAVALLQQKKDFARAEVVEVLEPSVSRVEPPCPAYHAGCGGCTWQHVAPAHQLRLKADVVIEALRRTGKIAEPVVEVGSSVPPWEYRTTLRVAVDNGRLGLHRRQSHDVIELDGCPISHPRLQDLLRTIRVEGDGEVSLRVGASSGERSAFVVDGNVEFVELPSDVAVGPAAAIHETVAGRDFRVSAASFFQSGPAAAELLVAAVNEACADLPAVDDLVDAYGGVGLFAATIDANRVVVVEGSVAACADATANLAGRRAKVVHAQVEQWKPRHADLVVADPSRTGLGRQAVSVLTDTLARRIVLVSCDPVALARDAALLRDRGYHHVRSTVHDLFPQTHHVEVVATFERRSAQ
jgi:23S rRNA (uracil1939-C5)-methyltransferase